jgi:hypothetical protein
MITWPESMLLMVGFVDFCKFVLALGFVTPSSIWFHAIEVLVIGHRDCCVGMVDVVLSLWAFSCLCRAGGLLDYTCITQLLIVIIG